jgi:hypothetical protein
MLLTALTAGAKTKDVCGRMIYKVEHLTFNRFE